MAESQKPLISTATIRHHGTSAMIHVPRPTNADYAALTKIHKFITQGK